MDKKIERFPIFRTGIGQDSHRFLSNESSKPCIVGGIVFEHTPGLEADSDGDVIYHAICNAITSLSGVPILGKIAPHLCHEEGIVNSELYLTYALHTLRSQKIVHIALSLEGKRPHFQKKIEEMRANIAHVLNLSEQQIGITATSGDDLTDFGRGLGLQCLCILTTREDPL